MHLENIKIDIDLDIGLQMKDICKRLNLKHCDVAKEMKISEPLLSYYMNNKRVQRIDVIRDFLKVCREKFNDKECK